MPDKHNLFQKVRFSFTAPFRKEFETHITSTVQFKCRFYSPNQVSSMDREEFNFEKLKDFIICLSLLTLPFSVLQ